jgi:hypothetical protein
MQKSLVRFLAAAAILLAAAACLGTGPAAPAAPAPATERKYPGAGQDPSLLAAMNKAKIDAVRKAVIDMIGVANEQANRDALDKVIYSARNPNAFVSGDMETTRKDKAGDDYIIEGIITVRLDAVEATLKANGLMGGPVTTTASAAEAAAAGSDAQTSQADALSAGAAPAATADEQKIIRDYVEHMTYMVYFADGTTMDPLYAKSAVGIANQYLASQTMEAIDFAQVEKIKADQQKAYEAETGESMSITQWIAQKLNADVYIEIDGTVATEISGSKYYGQASITLKAFEASTGRLLGSVPWNSPKTLSTAGADSAVINALQTCVYKAMPTAISQSKGYMIKALASGIKYDLVIQKTPDSRLMNTFSRKLKEKVKDVKIVNQSESETKFNVFLIGSIEDLVDTVYNVAEKIPGLEDMKQVMLRGKAVTFNSGM